jgi:hypothetical protein
MKTESDVITDGNNGVVEWKDKYGVTHATQSDASKRPTLKKVESRRELLDRLNEDKDKYYYTTPYTKLLKLANHQEKVIEATKMYLMDILAGEPFTPETLRQFIALADAPMEGEENGI